MMGIYPFQINTGSIVIISDCIHLDIEPISQFHRARVVILYPDAVSFSNVTFTPTNSKSTINDLGVHRGHAFVIGGRCGSNPQYSIG